MAGVFQGVRLLVCCILARDVQEGTSPLQEQRAADLKLGRRLGSRAAT